MAVEEIREYVVKELSKYRPQDDIIREVCELYRCRWPEAEELVRQIAAIDRDKITSRRRPIVAIANIGMAVGGGLLTIALLILTFAGVVISPLWAPIPYLGNIVFLVTALGMAVRGVVGIVQTVKAPEL
jgi:hypothetical protein